MSIMKNYLIKRNPTLTKRGLIVKQNDSCKGYSETTIRNKKPSSSKLKKDDVIYVAETNYGIFAYGKVIDVKKVKDFKSTDELVDYYKQAKTSDTAYWLDLMIRLRDAKQKDPNAILKYQEYQIDQKILPRTVQLIGSLEPIKYYQGIVELSDEVVNQIKLQKPDDNLSLSEKIPSALRLDLYSLCNYEYSITHWIDIDHFVPKSIGGPGNILENLIPVGLTINRYKGARIPSGLFAIASEQIPDLKVFCRSEYMLNTPSFLRKSRFPKVEDDAIKIVKEVNKRDIKFVKSFYLNVMRFHNPEYAKILYEKLLKE